MRRYGRGQQRHTLLCSLANPHAIFFLVSNKRVKYGRAAFTRRHEQRKTTLEGWGVHLPCVFSLRLLKRNLSCRSRRLNAQTLGATCQPTFLGSDPPSLLRDHAHPGQASHSLAHISPPPSPVTPHPLLPTPPSPARFVRPPPCTCEGKRQRPDWPLFPQRLCLGVSCLFWPG